MYWRVTTATLRLPWWVAAARVVERTDAEEGRFRWTVEAPNEADPVLRLLPGVLTVEPLPNVRGGPGKLAA